MATTQASKVTTTMDAEAAQNAEDIERQWAVNAMRHAEVYVALLRQSANPATLKLTMYDDEIYEHFRRAFPDFNVDVVDEASLKSEAAKAAWRDFCEQYKTRMENYNYGSLLRLNSKEDYTEQNTIFVLRVQFLAIEIARNREGLNAGLKSSAPSSSSS